MASITITAPSPNISIAHSLSSIAVCGEVGYGSRERITLGDAARLAAVDRWTMRDILREHGVDLRIGLVDEADVADEIAAASELEYGTENSDEEDYRGE